MCFLLLEIGFCRGVFLKFYFDFSFKFCKFFMYGGCDGNGNKFDIEVECMVVCGG